MSPTAHHQHHHHHADAAENPGAAWDQRYTEVTWSGEPDQTMVELVGDLPPGTALDVGGGTGRNALWLASRGWAATIVDASAVGLDQATRRAGDLGLSVACELADLREWRPRRVYDLVVVANIHMPPENREWLFASVREAVAPGGYLYVVGHHIEALGLAGPPDPRSLYTEEILTRLVSGLRIEQLRRVTHRADHGDVGMDVALLARRDPADVDQGDTAHGDTAHGDTDPA